MGGMLRLHTLVLILSPSCGGLLRPTCDFLPNCLFGLNGANFPLGNADLRIPGSTRLHNTIHCLLVSHHISRLLRVHMTPPYYILCIYIVPIVRMDWYCSTR